MDESVNPCEDFYEFACGEYLRKTDIPEDKSSLTSFSIIQDEVDKQLEKILTEEPQQNETKPFKLAKIFTKTCLDEATLNERGNLSMEKCFRVFIAELFGFCRNSTVGGYYREIWRMASR